MKNSGLPHYDVSNVKIFKDHILQTSFQPVVQIHDFHVSMSYIYIFIIITIIFLYVLDIYSIFQWMVLLLPCTQVREEG